jgi:hypothetical protein
MVVTFSRAGVRYFFAMVAIGGLILGTLPGDAGEPIQFSNKPTKVTLPKPSPKATPEDESFNFMKDTGTEGLHIPPSTQPNSSSSRLRRLQELKDKQENWIFSLPEETKRRATAEEMFELEEWTSEKPKAATAVERYWEAQGEKHKEDARANSKMDRKGKGDSDSKEQETRNDQGDESFSVTGEMRETGAVEEKSLLDWDSRFQKNKGESAVSGLGPKEYMNRFFSEFSLPTSAANDREQSGALEKRAEGFKKLLETGATPAEFGSPSDPINSIFDSTRQELQPVMGKALDASSPAAGLAGFPESLPGSRSAQAVVGSSLFDGFGSRGGGGPISLPTPTLEPERRAPVPTMLDFPRRKF